MLWKPVPLPAVLAQSSDSVLLKKKKKSQYSPPKEILEPQVFYQFFFSTEIVDCLCEVASPESLCSCSHIMKDFFLTTEWRTVCGLNEWGLSWGIFHGFISTLLHVNARPVKERSAVVHLAQLLPFSTQNKAVVKYFDE